MSRINPSVTLWVVIRSGLSLLAGAILVAAILMAQHFLGGGLLRVAPVVLDLGGSSPVEISRPGQHVTVPLAFDHGLKARHFSRVTLDLDARAPGHRFSIAWFSSDDTGRVFKAPLARISETRYQAHLSDETNWQGAPLSGALIVEGVPRYPVSLRTATLDSPDLGSLAALRATFADWITLEGWGARGWAGFSVDQIGARDVGAPLTLTAAAAAWVGLSLLLFGLWSWARRDRVEWAVAVAFVLAAWIVLDLRWQVDLWQQMESTRAQYSGKSWEEKRLASEDADIVGFINRFKERVDENTARIFVIDERDQYYQPLRAKYYLLPRTAAASLPALEWLQPGDHLMVFRTANRLSVSRIEDRDRTGRREYEHDPVMMGAREFAVPSTGVSPHAGTIGRCESTHREGGGLVVEMPAQTVLPGAYRFAFHLTDPLGSESVRLVVDARDEDGNLQARYNRQVSVPPGGDSHHDLGVEVPGGGYVHVAIEGASDSLCVVGLELKPIIDRPLLVVARPGSDVHRLVEPVFQSGMGSVYRVR